MIRILLHYVMIIGLSCSAYCQKKNNGIIQGNTSFNNYSFIDAIDIYKKVLQKGYRSPELFQRLADSYYFNGEYTKALEYYNQFFIEEPKPLSEYLYRYSLCLKSAGKTEKADSLMQVFTTRNIQDTRARIYTSQADYMSLIQENSGRYEIHELDLNTDYSDYGPAFLGRKLVFTSNKPGKRKGAIDKWSNQVYSSIYVAEPTADENFTSPQPFASGIKAPYHESTPVFTKDGRTMYFTANNLQKSKESDNSFITLKLYKATLVNNTWSDVEELSINDPESSTAHPALSPDEKTLYFSSDRVGSIGSSDLYRCTINDDGTLGNPENLGLSINTESRETFPFISDNNELYFASDGYPGLGGLDLYRAPIQASGAFGEPVNLGAPLNSSDDDFCFIIRTSSRKGYFASNRPGKAGKDNIYSLTETVSLPKDAGQHKPIAGVIREYSTAQPMEGVTVTLYDRLYNTMLTTITDKEGKYELGELGYSPYRIKVEKPGYETVELQTDVSTTAPEEHELEQELVKKTIVPQSGINLIELLNIHDLYFEFNATAIMPLAEADLAKVLVFLNKYPKVKLDICAHTDARGDERYNYELSLQRAKNAVSWLVQRGIDKHRLMPVGYGESRLINECTDDVDCSEKRHRQNRRVDFIIKT